MTDSETSPLPCVVLLTPRFVRSNSILYNARNVPVRERAFNLVLRLGEIGTAFDVNRAGPEAAASDRGLT